MPRPAYTLGAAIASVMDHAGISTVALAERLRERGWKPDQSLVSKWRNGHARPHNIDMYPDIEDICGAPRGTIFRLAGYVDDGFPDDIDRTDDDEVAIWNFTDIPEEYRRDLLKQLREIKAAPEPPLPSRRQPRPAGKRRAS